MRRLAVSLATAGLLLWPASPAQSAPPSVAPAGVPRAVDFEQALDLSDRVAGRSGPGVVRSGVIRAPQRFDLVGLSWRSPHHVSARIRVRDPRGRWSAWTALGDRHDGGHGSEPVWVGGADAYELRLGRLPRGLRAQFVNSTGSATPAARARGARARSVPLGRQAAAGAPPIIPRAAWGGDQCPPRTAPRYGEVQVGFVHHTVSANEYGPADSAAMVLAICRYHRNANGWLDVGYNFLVDRYGQVFEGRAGGIDQPVVGAQAAGYNAVSTGVANIGTFTDAGPTPEAVHATAALLAWKLSLHGAPLTGAVTVTSGGGASNRYSAGTPVALERISGHRDANATECPGAMLYPRLGEIRAQAAALAPSFGGPASTLTLDALDSTLEFPQPAQLSGRLTGAGGAPLAGMPISIQLQGAAGFYPYQRALTGSDGSWSASVPTAFTRTLRVAARLPDGSTARSRSVALVVAPRVRLRSRTHVVARRMFTVSGSLRPRRGRVVVELQRKSQGAMRTIGRFPVKVSDGSYGLKLRLRKPGLHRMRAVFAADGRNSAASSAYVWVRAWRR